MHVRFPEADASFIKAEVQNGSYTNETELVRDAVRRMREEKERARRFQDAIAAGGSLRSTGEQCRAYPGAFEKNQEACR